MNREVAFWDASALVRVCVYESASQFARQQMRRFASVVWWGTRVEVYGALYRLRRAS